MISKNLYFNIILRVSLIVLLSILLGYLIVKDQSLRFSLMFLLICSKLNVLIRNFFRQ
jgi:hypothetical protein